MGDYFDDDDLINEYMEEDFEPPDYDEAFLEAEFAAANNINDAAAPEPMPQEPPWINPENETLEENLAVPVTTVTIQPPEKKVDAYSFERYQGNWRREQQETDKSTAKEWKKGDNSSRWEEALLLNSCHNNPVRKPSAPDAQLVELSQRKNLKFKVKPSCSVSLKPIEGHSTVNMTLGDETRVYVKQTTAVSNSETPTETNGNILGVSMTELLRRSDTILRKAERQKVVKRPLTTTAITADENVQPKINIAAEDTPTKKVQFASQLPTKHDPDSQLWVDKHAPSEFSHLLSDERTNREVLRALRAWDPYVFGREAPPRPTFLQQKQGESDAKKRHGKFSEQQTTDIRPDESNRVILLSGPPGIGKTTLAHIIARHAGYRPMEVNASDERSSAVLKDRVVRAMESSTLNLKRRNGTLDELAGRPNCIILDEVDGADAKGAIGALVEMIRAEIPAKGSKHNKTFLRRPIIFICNHKYSPALRPLLPFARQFDVSPPSPNRLMARLRAVLSEESLSVFGGSSLLNQLMNGAGGDIRACLFALQFAAARARELNRRKEVKDAGKKGTSSVVDISSSLKAALGGTGLKDERSDASTTVTAVFLKKKEQRLGKSTSGKATRIEGILQLVESFGDDTKMLDCVFTNLMNVSYVDPTLDRCTLAHEWLSSTDLCRSKHFLPAAAAAIHLLCRVETRAKLTFSNRQMVDARYQMEANNNLAEKFVEGLAPSARGGATKGTAALETVPYSLWMLSAGDGSFSLRRGVSSMEILNKHERAAFDAHVSTLRSLGLTYVARGDATTRTFHDNQAVAMRLEPQIDRLVQFDGLIVPPASRRKYIPHVLKELLAHGALIQGMRESDNKKTAARVTPDTSPEKVEQDVATADAIMQEFTAQEAHSSIATKKKLETSQAVPSAKRQKTAKPNFLGIGAAKAKAARNARKAALVGFDKSKHKHKISNSGSGIPFSQVVRFKYQKGFTQAVRTPCKIEDII